MNAVAISGNCDTMVAMAFLYGRILSFWNFLPSAIVNTVNEWIMVQVWYRFLGLRILSICVDIVVKRIDPTMTSYIVLLK